MYSFKKSPPNVPCGHVKERFATADVLEVNSIKTAKTYPAIKLLDFSDLEKVDLDLLFDYELQDRLDFDFTAESVLDNYFK